MDGASPAVAVAREQMSDGIVTLSTGVRARLRPVAATLIEEVTSHISNPPVPSWFNTDKDREEPNPGDPEYRRAVAEANRKRGIAAIDALVMFGVQLVEPIPPDKDWLDQLKFFERRGHLSLASYDLTNPLDREFLYKRFIAVASEDLIILSKNSGVRPEEVSRAAVSFPGGAAGDASS